MRPKPKPRRLFRKRPTPAMGDYVPTWHAPPPAAIQVLREGLLRQVKRGEARCLLCGQRSICVGVWQPSAEYQPRIGASADAPAHALYTLCRPHSEGGPGLVLRKVERHILAHSAVALGNPQAN